MQINYFTESARYDCAANEVYGIIESLKRKRTKQSDAARAIGEEPPKFFDMVITDLGKLRKEYQTEADALFRRHRELSPDFDEDGINNLMCAIAKSWANDYERALCMTDDYREKRIQTLLAEAEYVVTPKIVKRINKAHERFVKIACEKVFEIVEDTQKEHSREKRTGGNDHNSSRMRNRCPCCGGGLYSQKISTDRVKVRCPSCSMFCIVRVVS